MISPKMLPYVGIISYFCIGINNHFKVYGDIDGKNADGSDKYKEQYTPLTSGSAVSTIDFSASSLGSNIYRITLQTLAGAQSARVKGVALIKSDGTEVLGKITVAWGCSLSTEFAPKTSDIQSVNSRRPANEAIYNLSGQRLLMPSKGIYIKNGKKYMK